MNVAVIIINFYDKTMLSYYYQCQIRIKNKEISDAYILASKTILWLYFDYIRCLQIRLTNKNFGFKVASIYKYKNTNTNIRYRYGVRL